jgi:hypothetical protein
MAAKGPSIFAQLTFDELVPADFADYADEM